MKIVYIEGNSPSDDLAENCANNIVGMFRYANINNFKDCDTSVKEVYTDHPDIMEAYKKRKINVKGLPDSKPDKHIGRKKVKKSKLDNSVEAGEKTPTSTEQTSLNNEEDSQ